MRGLGIPKSQGKLSRPAYCSPASRRRSNLTVTAAGGSNNERQPWDFGRFLRTVFFFNRPPTPEQVVRTVLEQPIKVMTSMAPAATSSLIPLIGVAPTDAGRRKDGIVLVTGATGGVGRRVVALLLERGRHVRALVRDVEKARSLLAGLPAAAGACLEIAPADLSQRQTLLPEYTAGVRQVVWCSATKIVPKEGDTVDRSKYYQGIKFYDPEVQGDTPEAVEYRGMLNLLQALEGQVPSRKGGAIFAPADTKAPAKEWGPVDDVVMGGVSSSALTVRPGAGEHGGPAGVFAGRVTTANNGGFASVRTRNLSPPIDVSGYDGLELRIRGDGQRYKCIIRTEASWDGVGYTVSFDTKAGEWQSVRLPFDAFVPVFRAKTVPDAPQFDTTSVTSVQLMISKFEYDGRLNPSFREGEFELPVERVGAYIAEPVKARFVMVSSAGVTRPNRPGINIDEEPPAVKLNDALGGLLTYKLAGEDALRASGVPFAVVRPVALTEEDAGAELQLDQGDVIRGKISRDDVSQLCVTLLEDEVGADTTFEIKSTVPFSTPYVAEEGASPRDWSATLRAAGLKKGVTGKTIDGVYTGKEPENAVAKTGVTA